MNKISKTKPPIRYVELDKTNYQLLTAKHLEDIVFTALDAFGSGMSREEVLNHVYPTDRLYLAYRGEKIFGFATAKLNETAVDLVGAAVLEEAQGNGVYNEFCARRINLGINAGKEEVTFRTQNPRIESGVCSCISNLMGLGIIEGYTLTREIKKGLYGRMLTKEQPLCGVEEIDHQYLQLDYKNGDTFSFSIKLVMKR